MSSLSTAGTRPGSLGMMSESPEYDDYPNLMMTPEYEDYPDLPACSLCLSLNTSDYCHHTGQSQPIRGQYCQSQPNRGQYCQSQPIRGQYCQSQPIRGQYCQSQPIRGQYCQSQPIRGQYCQSQPIKVKTNGLNISQETVGSNFQLFSSLQSLIRDQ